MIRHIYIPVTEINPHSFDLRPICKGMAWLWLISNANWKEGGFNHGGQRYPVKRGQVGLRLRPIAAKWGWTKSTVQRFLLMLQNIDKIRYETDTGFCLVTICNYDKLTDPSRKTGQSCTESVPESGTKSNYTNLSNKDKSNNIIEDCLDKLDSYFFVGDNYRLTKADFDKYKGRWSNLFPRQVKSELDRADKYYSENPGKLKNTHFQFLAWLDKANKREGVF